MGRRFLGEPALAHPGLAGEREQAAATGDRAVDPGADFGQFPAPADEGLSAANGVQVAHLRLVQARTTNSTECLGFRLTAPDYHKKPVASCPLSIWCDLAEGREYRLLAEGPLLGRFEEVSRRRPWNGRYLRFAAVQRVVFARVESPLSAAQSGPRNIPTWLNGSF